MANATDASVSVVVEVRAAVFVKALLRKFHTAGENRNSHDKQDIADDRACD
jgi:hypothetical protein